MSLYPTISAKAIIAKAYADLNVQESQRWEVWMEWISEALEHIGAFTQYVTKGPITIPISNYRGNVPCDLVNVLSVTKENYPLRYGLSPYDRVGGSGLHKSLYGYTIEYPYITVNFKDGEVKMLYHAVPTDEEGYPLIPDRISLKEACVRYIIYKEALPDMRNGTIDLRLYNKLEYDWQRYAGQARGDLNMPNQDKMESIKNSWLRLIPNIHGHDSFYATDNLSERSTSKYIL
ncbi:MAG: hypothetical protein HC836_47195 [Richelia sp. RM2_1_2]|nr:hypothetical protein [Richelia sp. RM2_1_2]